MRCDPDTTPRATPLLALKEATVSFQGFVAVDHLDLAVSAGELRCLIGPNGAGKTTTLDLICGKSRITSGEIHFKGRPIHPLKEFQIARSGIGRKFQVPSVFRELTVRENLEIGQSGQPGVLRNLLRFGGNGEAEKIERIALLVGLQDEMETQPRICRTARPSGSRSR